MTSTSSIRRLQFCNFKLESLLAITTAINDNLSVEALLLKFEKLLLEELKLGKVVVYAHSTTWNMVLKSGADYADFADIVVETDLLPYNEITSRTSTENERLAAFDFIIPVYQAQQPIAFVLIGDVEEEQEGVSPTIKHLHFVQTLTNIIFVAVENKRLFADNIKQEGLRKEMELASKVQNMLIPDSRTFPKNPHIAIEAYYLPHYQVGGDYYDFEEITENEFFFCIADVSGKGISAAMLMSNFQATLQAYLNGGMVLESLIHQLNKIIIRNAQGDRFITFFAGKYNYQTHELQYVNAGHNPPYFFDTVTEEISELRTGCVGVGMLDEIPRINTGIQKIENRSKLIMFTDGVAELEDGQGHEVGLEFLKRAVADSGTIHATFANIKNTLNISKSNLQIFDDITLLGVEFY